MVKQIKELCQSWVTEISSIIAIRLGDQKWFKNLCLLIYEFVEMGKLQEAHDLYVCLKDEFPNVSKLKFDLRVRTRNTNGNMLYTMKKLSFLIPWTRHSNFNNR